jgi:PAS domain S-box-containing protein
MAPPPPVRKAHSYRFHYLAAHLLVAVSAILVGVGVSGWNTYQHRIGLVGAVLSVRAGDAQLRVDSFTAEHARAIETLARLTAGCDRDEMSRDLAIAASSYGGFAGLAVLDRENRVLAAAQGSQRRHSGLPSPPPDPGPGRGGVHISDAYSGDPGGGPVSAVTQKLSVTPGGTMSGGTLVGFLDLHEMGRSLGQGASTSGYLILDRKNRVVFASRGIPIPPLMDLSTSPLAALHREPMFAYRHDGEGPADEYLVGKAPAESPYGWRVLVLTPSSVRHEAVLTVLKDAGISLAVAILVCLGLAEVQTRRASSQLRILLNQVREIANRRDVDWSASAVTPVAFDGRAPAEISDLAQSVEAIANHLRNTNLSMLRLNEELEARVRERTQDLLGANRKLREAGEQRAQVEEMLALRNRAMEATSEGITIADANLPGHPLVYVNSGFERLTGYAASELLGRSGRFLIGKDTDQGAVAELGRMVAGFQPCSLEMLNYRKGGAPFWNHFSITPVRNAEGQVTHFVGVHVDVTAQKEVDRIKNELVSTVSHELRTPLTSMRGFAELLIAREFPPDKARKFLTIIRDESARLSGLVNDFLDIQRMESGYQTFFIEDVAIGEVLVAAASVMQVSAAEHEIRVEEQCAGLLARADRQKIRQVVDNLLSNAVKFSPEGGVVDAGCRAEDGQVVVWVRDHGLGIPEDAIPRLFTKFYRVDNSATREIGGTGLGLELARQIVERHQGKIWVESRLGQGSTFYFTLPLAGQVAGSESQSGVESLESTPVSS